MAVAPTRTQATDMVTDAVRVLAGGLAGVAGVPADLQQAVAGLITDAPELATRGLASYRASLARALVAPARQLLEPALINFVRTQVNSAEADIDTVISRMYDDLIANAETIQSRNITYGPAVPDGSNVGQGTIFRLTEDSQGFDLEATHVDEKTVRCVADQTINNGTKHRELFVIEGQRAGVDAIEILGSGANLEAGGQGGTQSKISQDSKLANTGFDSFSLQGGFTAGIRSLVAGDVVTSWELLDAAGTAIDETLYELDQNDAAQARALVGVANPTSLRMVAAATLRQFLSVNGVNLALGVPHAIVLHVLPTGADGSITVTWGNKSQAITLASLNNGVWNKVPIDFDLDLWPGSFNEENPAFLVAWDGTVGDVVFDELEALVPMTGFDGVWFHISGDVDLTIGVTWVEKDEVVFADTLVGSDSELQQQLFRLEGRHLPHSLAPTAIWAEPF